MHVAGRAPGRVGQGLLGDQDERPLGHPPGADRRLGLGDLLERAADVDGAGPARRLVGPRHAAAHGEVDLVRRRAVPPAPVGAPRAARAARRRGSRDRPRAGVEQRDPGGRQVRPRRAPGGRSRRCRPATASSEASASVMAADPPSGDRPAVPVPGRGQHHADRGGGGPVERPEDVRRRTGEQRPGLRRAEPRGQHGGRQPGPQTEPRHPDRVVGPAQRSARARPGPARRSLATSGANTRRQAGPSTPRPAQVSSSERTITPAVPSSSGCARSTSG